MVSLSILEIARKHRYGDVDVLATFYGLSVLGMVINPQASASQALRQLPVGYGERALAPQTMDQLPGFAELVREKYADVREADYFKVLGLDRVAPRALKFVQRTMIFGVDSIRIACGKKVISGIRWTKFSGSSRMRTIYYPMSDFASATSQR